MFTKPLRLNHRPTNIHVTRLVFLQGDSICSTIKLHRDELILVSVLVQIPVPSKSIGIG